MAELREQLQGTLGDSYQLEQELGGGGMSRVFVAHETSLGRKVVVKVLPPEMAAAVSIDRFRREIQLAAQLQHPHIVPLLSAGETAGLPYFTMPFVKGESLRARLNHGELPVSEAIRILREIASALAYAHENGVVHRDIKPENILISGGSAMVTDFGVAKAVSASTGAEGHSLTSLGVALGTPAYMAPEQATADPNTDYRADIYALGVVAYEMLTGSTPFPGRSPQATLAAQVTEAPDTVTRRRPAVPAPLATLVMKCLEKRPADRPQTAADVMHELDALSTPSGGLTPTSALPAARSNSFARRAAIGAAGVVALALIGFAAMRARRPTAPASTATVVPAIAVLPFENRGRPEGQEFTDGMTEEITNRLTSVRGLRVIGRQSASAYASTQKTPQQIAQELGVQYILTGTVRWDKGSDGKEIVRVSPALTRTADATQVWAEAYQTVLSGMFEVQSKVATEVANALNIALIAPEKDALAAKPTDNVEAYSLYLRGNDLLTKSVDIRDLRLAIEALEKAVAADPKFALAYSRLSFANTEIFWFNGDRSTERLRKAKAAADKALELDPSLAAAQVALGVYYYHGFLDYDNALAHLSEAEKARPNDFETIFYKAAIQRRQGKWKEATGNMRRALELEPRIAVNFSDAANTFFFMRNYDEAVRLCDRAIVLEPTDYQGYSIKANVAVAREGDVVEATRIRRRQFDAQPDPGIAASGVLFDPWPEVEDPKMRDAAVQVGWSPDRGEKSSFYVAKMELFLRMGDQSRAKAYADSAVAVVTEKIREIPNEAGFYMELASAQAVLGRKPEALGGMQKAVTLQPFSKDQFLGTGLYVTRAITLMRLVESDEAISQLEQLLKVPSVVSRNYLRLDPLFTPLRSNPRFQKLIQGN
jgi:TolB-like protein/tRNA A-37 threonylcarbamoyl transferase component Bud32/Flp pilus assembly protein TadD